ncbi:15360_t:CDS:2 [Funneliformis geosporum]|uniref:15360_t:CDS:1 n=1 Tax=Funneliformis geosporum TaxID=1117311 RepID=A0A9W4WK45_9GLOM|nr:15360_t:CDS:2 [Funneliformis geosporum]
MDATQARGTTVLPIARVKRIIKLDEEITTIGTDSTFLIAIAAELFVDYFVKKGVDQAKSEKRKVIRYEDMAYLVKNNENLGFLQDIVPETQAFEDYLKNRNRKKRKRKTKDENDNSSDLEDSPLNVGEVSETDTINENDSDVSEDNDENDSEEETDNESEVENGLIENSEVESSINGRDTFINNQKRNGKNVVNVIINNGVSSGSELSDAPETSSENSTVLNDEN